MKTMDNHARDHVILAYGLLWLMPTNTSTRAGRLGYQARQLLLQMLTPADRRLGIERAQAMQLRRCDSNLVDAAGECLACGAIQGEACRKPPAAP